MRDILYPDHPTGSNFPISHVDCCLEDTSRGEPSAEDPLPVASGTIGNGHPGIRVGIGLSHQTGTEPAPRGPASTEAFVVEFNPRKIGSAPWAMPKLPECVQIAPGRWCQWTVHVVANRASPVVCWSPGKRSVTRRLGDPHLSVGVFFGRYNSVPGCCSGSCCSAAGSTYRSGLASAPFCLTSGNPGAHDRGRHHPD